MPRTKKGKLKKKENELKIRGAHRELERKNTDKGGRKKN